MGLAGGDAPALFGFANELRRRRARIEAATNRLTALVNEANWVGPDRDAFMNEWNERHAPSLMSIGESLGNAATRAARAAAKQERASE